MTSIVLKTNSLYKGVKSTFNKAKFSIKYTDSKGVSQNIKINNVLAERISNSKTLTRVPMQIGADLNDHSYLNPATISIEIAESKFTNVLQTIQDQINDFYTISNNIIKGDFLGGDNGFYQENIATNKYQELVGVLQNLEIFFDLSTTLGNYSNMILVGLYPTTNVSTTGGFYATMEFMQGNFIDTETGGTLLGLALEGGFKQKIDFLSPLGGLFE